MPYSTLTACFAAILPITACSAGGGADSAPADAPAAVDDAAATLDATATDPAPSDGQVAETPQTANPGVVSTAGIAAWEALPTASQDRLRTLPILYLHQSVGQDLEDGCEANGFRFEYFGPNQSTLAAGLNGGIFNDVGNVPNGEPFAQMALIRQVFAAVRDRVRVFSFSFGYADIRDSDLAAVEAEYQTLVGEIEAAGVRFVHVTPPLVFSVDENPPKMAMRTWMLATFPEDVIFDLQDLESLDGGQRCEIGGVWHICQAHRSTVACPSKGQGIDGDGAGHLCETKAREFAKALLFAYDQASR